MAQLQKQGIMGGTLSPTDPPAPVAFTSSSAVVFTEKGPAQSGVAVSPWPLHVELGLR